MQLLADCLQNVSICGQLDSVTFPLLNSLGFTSFNVAAILILTGSVRSLK